MNFQKQIDAFIALGDYILSNPTDLQEITHKTYLHNTWFTKENTEKALQNIASAFLQKGKLENWLYTYAENLDKHTPKTFAIVAAGNIPLVAFHDVLCVLISGNQLQIKLSDKDKFILPFLFDKLVEFEPTFEGKISMPFKLENFDAIIATGSNNSAKYFEHYFSKYKNIIRKNRNSVAILSGHESIQDIENLGHDIFDYFGLGCRNVSKIFVPESYDLLQLKEGFEKHKDIMQHTQYMNNLDYQRTVYLMNQIPLVDIDFINIVENPSMHSPISCLHVERYKVIDMVNNSIIENKDELQCVVGKNYLSFGSSQQPALNDYADNVDTLAFILSN